jgi:hypothetical protein
MLKFPNPLRTQLSEPSFFDKQDLFAHFPLRLRPGDTLANFLFSDSGTSSNSFCFVRSEKLNSSHSLINYYYSSESFSSDFSGLTGASGSYRISEVGS